MERGYSMVSWLNRFKGVGTFVDTHSSINIKQTATDDQGRYVITQFVENNETFVLANVYAPNKDSPQFFSELFNKMLEWEGHKIVVGDFNLIMDNNMDRTEKVFGGVKNNDKARELIEKFMEEGSMTDIWRDQNPDKKHFTWRGRRTGYVARHIDMFLTDISLNGWITETKIQPGFRSDHSQILLEVVPHKVNRGRGVWRLNTSVLTELEFCTKINETIETCQWYVRGQNPQDKWESIKLELIKASQQYCQKRAGNKRLIANQL